MEPPGQLLIVPPSLELSQLNEVIENYKELPSEDAGRVLLLLGQTGVGKSSFVNYIMNSTVSDEAGGYLACTKDSRYWDTPVNGHATVLRLIDTPGLFDPERNPAKADDARYIVQECDRLMAEFERAFFLAGPRIHAVGLVLNIGERFSLESQMMIEVLKRLKINMDHVILIFTHGDSLFEGGEQLPSDADHVEARYQLLEELKSQDNLPLGITKLLAEVQKRFVIVEKFQPGERENTLHKLSLQVEQISDRPIQNGRFEEERQAWKKRKQESDQREQERHLAMQQLSTVKNRHQTLQKENIEVKHRYLGERKRFLKQLYSAELTHEEMRTEYRLLKEKVDLNEKMLAVLMADVCITRGINEDMKESQSVYLQKVESMQAEIDRSYAAVQHNIVEPKLLAYLQSLRAICEHREVGKVHFEEAAKSLDKYFKSEAAVRVVGTSLGVAGGVTAVVGLALLIPLVSIPAGVVLIVGGLATSTVGGVTSVGVSVVDIMKKKKEIKSAQEWILEEQQLVKDAVVKRGELEKELVKVEEVFPDQKSQMLPSCFGLSDVEDLESFQDHWSAAEDVVAEWNCLQESDSDQVALDMAQQGETESEANKQGEDLQQTPLRDGSGTGQQQQSGEQPARYRIDGGNGVKAGTVRTAVLGAGAITPLSVGFTVVDLALLARACKKVHKRKWHTRLANSLQSAAAQFEAETERIYSLAYLKQAQNNL